MAVDRKQQMKEITERLEQGVKDIFTSEMYTTYLRTMAKFHNYSFNNTLLIAMQRPDATLVAGFNAWKNKFNRYVKKGEKGIQIIAPAPIKEVEEREKIDKDTGLAVLNENGEPEMERVEYVVPRFRVTTVFDVFLIDSEHQHGSSEHTSQEGRDLHADRSGDLPQQRRTELPVVQHKCQQPRHGHAHRGRDRSKLHPDHYRGHDVLLRRRDEHP